MKRYDFIFGNELEEYPPYDDEKIQKIEKTNIYFLDKKGQKFQLFKFKGYYYDYQDKALFCDNNFVKI